jgi:excisionase family DNA binding protein
METEANRSSPLALTIHEAVRISGLSRSELYRRLSDGKVRAVKSGSRTLILMDSLQAHLANLPAATFRAPKAA